MQAQKSKTPAEQQQQGPPEACFISGVSLAPLPDAEVLDAVRAAAGAAAQEQQQPPRKAAQAKVVAAHTHAVAPQGRLQDAAPAVFLPGTTKPEATKVAAEVPRLMATGRSVGHQRPAPLNPNMLLYHEINGVAESLCGTPPALSLEDVAKGFDSRCYGPLGPLAPAPLSPSILTLCGELESFEPQSPGEGGWGGGMVRNRGDRSGLWGSFGTLPDMRQCESPVVSSS